MRFAEETLNYSGSIETVKESKVTFLIPTNGVNLTGALMNDEN